MALPLTSGCPAFSTATATATCGSSAGAAATNHAMFGRPPPVSAVPVLPPTLTPGIRAFDPVLVHDLHHHPHQGGGVLLGHGPFERLGLGAGQHGQVGAGSG